MTDALFVFVMRSRRSTHRAGQIGNVRVRRLARVRSAGQTARDLLQYPIVPVRIVERRIGTIRRALGRKARNAAGISVGLKLRAGRSRVKDRADRNAARGERIARGHDVGHDEIVAVRRTGCGRREAGTELHRTG